MYADEKNLVTTGIGNLIDLSPLASPWTSACKLPWKHLDLVTPASQAEIIKEWNLVKARQEMTVLGGGAYAAITKLRLTLADVDELVVEAAADFEAKFVKRFPEYESWPADAQLGALSLMWAAGPYFYATFPRFDVAADRLDFDMCAEQGQLSGKYFERNKATRICFQNAAAVYRLPELYDPAKLYWPTDLYADDNPY